MLATLLAASVMAFPVAKLHVNVYTGGDDLRDGSEVYLMYSVRGERKESRLNTRGERWADRTWSNTEIDLGGQFEDSEILIRGIRFVAGKREHMQDDQWEFHGLRISGQDRSRTIRTMFRDETIRRKFTRSGEWLAPSDRRISEGSEVRSNAPQYMEFELFTGRDDLRSNSAVHVTFIFAQQYRITEYMRGPIGAGSSKKNRIRLPVLRDHTLWRIEIMMVEEGRGGTETIDHWDFDGIRVDLPGTEDDYYNTVRRARLAAGEVYRSPIIGSYGEDVDPNVSGIYVTVLTGEDDLKRSSRVLLQIPGPRGNYTKEMQDLKRLNRSYHYVPVTGVRLSDLRKINVIGASMPTDDWSLKGLAVDAAVGPGAMMRVFENWDINQRFSDGSRWSSPDFRR